MSQPKAGTASVPVSVGDRFGALTVAEPTPSPGTMTLRGPGFLIAMQAIDGETADALAMRLSARLKVVAIGDRFGELTVATPAWSERHGKVVACTCDCGGSAIVRVEALKSGRAARCSKRSRHPWPQPR
jgi:hypothetical protein